jgi:hypothetical protein
MKQIAETRTQNITYTEDDAGRMLNNSRSRHDSSAEKVTAKYSSDLNSIPDKSLGNISIRRHWLVL